MEKAPNNTKNAKIFIGRSKEIESLSALYNTYLAGNALVATITGEPGIGKTCLVEHLFRKYRDCNYIYGKNGQFSDNDFTAISQILEQLTNYALTLSKESLRKIQIEMKKSIGYDISLLYKINPSISQILKHSIQSANNDLIKMKYRVKNAVFKYVSTIAEYCFPLIIFIDDLQWADTLCIEIVKTLIKKVDKSGVMLILSYRSNESSVILENLKSALQERAVFISMNKFSYEDVLECTRFMMPGKVKGIEEFAELIYKITNGNPFYIEKLLRILLHDGMIKRDGDTWDISEVMANGFLGAASAENFIGNCIWSHYYKDKFLLDIISCFQDVDLSLIGEITNLDKNEISQHVQDLVDASILTTNVARNEVTVAYSHDIIGSLVYGNISSEQKEDIHYFIANTMWEKMNRNERYDNIIVSHLLKSSRQKIANDADQWIDLLFTSGIGKKMIALVEQARQIFELCVDIFPYCKTKDKCFEVQLELECAECYCLLDRASEAHEIIASLIQINKDMSMIEDIKMKQLYIYHYQRQHSRVITLGKSLLNEMGLKVSKAQMPTNLLALKRLYSKKRIEKIASLPDITDDRLLKTLDILTLMTICATLSDDDLSACLCLKAAIYCGKSGSSPNSIIGYVAGAYIMLTVWKDKKRAFLLEESILQLLDSTDNSNKSFAYFILGTFFSPFSKSLTESEECLQKAIRYGETTGDFVFLGYSILSSLDNKAFMGISLDELQIYINQIRTDYSDLEQNNVTYNLQVHEAHVQALKFGSECFDENHISKRYNHLTEFEKYTEKGLMLQRLFLFGKIEKAYALVEKMMADINLLNGMISSIDIYLYMALTRINQHSRLEKSKQEKNIGKIKRVIIMVKNWSKQNHKDFSPVYALILAEYQTHIHKKQTVESLYNDAIDLSEGNLKLHALATWLYARNCRNKSISLHLASESSHLHRSWGAGAVADLIEKEFDLKKREKSDQYNNQEAAHFPLIELVKECENLDEYDTLKKFIMTVILNDYADYCAFIYENNEMITIGFESAKDGRVGRYNNGMSLEESNSVSTYISRHAYRTCQDIHYHPDGAKTIYSNDPYIINHPGRYIACLPIICHGVVAGQIYMENEDQDFDAHMITHIKNFLPVIASKITTIKDVNLFNILSEKEIDTILSERELDVLNLIQKGYSNQRISTDLNIAVGTVKNHISNILAKLEADSRAKAVYIAKEKNLI